MSGRSLYEQVVEVTSAYLGPAADRFISRQVINHLHKAPEKLIKTDLRDLIKWIKPAIALLTDDSGLVDEYIEQLKDIADIRGRV